MLSSNQVLNQGRYKILDHFGGVDSSWLYDAYDTVSDAKVVIRETVGGLGKVATAAQIENLKTVFAADAKRLTEVEHPSLLKIKDYFSEIDRQYLVMEACEGTDLAAMLEESERAPSISDVLKWADQILDGLHYLHAQVPPIFHKNVNPQNARLNSNFKIKLLVANESKSNSSEGGNEAAQPYRSLEQLWLGLDSASQRMIANSFGEKSEEILRSPLDARSDVYSAAATIYFLLTGKEPADPIARYLEILDENPDPLADPSELNASVPSEVSTVLMKALALKREDRFSSASEVRDELAKVKIPTRLADVKIDNTPVSPVEDTAVNQSAADERRRAESERIKLEAERHRLEEDRQGVEKQKLELEEEKRQAAQTIAKQHLEEERHKAARIESELAESARLSSEKAASDEKALRAAFNTKPSAVNLEIEKPEAVSAGTEKPRAHKLVLAKQQTAKEYKPLTAVTPENERMQLELADGDLLDLPEHVGENSVEPNLASDVLALDVEAPTTKPYESVHASFDLYSSEAATASFITRPPILIGIAAMLIVSIVIGWMLIGSGRSADAPSAAIQNPPTSQEKPIEPVTASQPVETQASESNSSIPSQVDEKPVVETEVLPAAETKTEQEVKAKPKKQQPPQVKNAGAAEKKKVTVDDLINDN